MSQLLQHFIFLGSPEDAGWLTGESEPEVGWTTHAMIEPGDQVYFYITAPTSAIVAVGTRLDDEWICEEYGSRWEGRTMHDVRVESHGLNVTMGMLRAVFPDWPWLRYPRQNAKVPDELVEPFLHLINLERLKAARRADGLCAECGKTRDGHSLAESMHQEGACDRFDGPFERRGSK